MAPSTGSGPVELDPWQTIVEVGWGKKRAVHFDGSTALYGLPSRPSNEAALSLSVWLNADAPVLAGPFAPDSGCLLASPYHAIPDPQVPDLQTIWYGFNLLRLAGQDYSDFANPKPVVDPCAWRGVTFADPPARSSQGYGVVAPLASAGAGSPAGDAWAHVLISVGNDDAGRQRCQFFIGRNQIVNADWTIVAAAGIRPFPFANVVDLAGETEDDLPSAYAIGGRMAESAGAGWGYDRRIEPGGYDKFAENLPADGTGLVADVDHLWIAPGHFIDWSERANREKFHTSESAPGALKPADLGEDGSRPLDGTRPWIYCAGDVNAFFVNRADEARPLTVFGELKPAGIAGP